MHIYKKRDINFTANMRLKRGYIVHRATIIINFDIILKSKLSSKNYILKVKKRAIKIIEPLSNIIRSTWGKS